MADETAPEDEPPGGIPSKKYDQDFFLALAAKGKDSWNTWRRDPANQDVRVTFAGIDFSEAPRDEIDFSGFEFGHDADFSGCKWRGVELKILQYDFTAFTPGGVYFTGATFGDRAKFVGAAISVYASFTGAAFGVSATFESATFGDLAGFVCATFGDSASFDRAAFDGEGIFLGAAFGEWAGFCGVTFDNGAVFDGVAFGDFAEFDNTVFKGPVEFTGKTKEQWSRVHKADADDGGKDDWIAQKTRHEDSWKRFGSGPDRFLTSSFANARFYGEANFSGRSFKDAADFTNARFYYPPDFDAAAKDARIDFTGAHIGFVPPGRVLHWTSDAKVPFRLRALRKLAEDTKNHDLERDLYIEERKAERGVYLTQWWGDVKRRSEELKKTLVEINKQKKWALSKLCQKLVALVAYVFGIIAKIPRLIGHLFWIIVMSVYWALSNYGRNFVLPFAWLIASGFAFYYWGYLSVLEPLMPKTCPLGDKYDHAVRMLALSNTVPFVGPLTIDSKIKEFLFCPNNAASCLPPIPPEGFQLLVIFQNLVSIILVFFIGLALRNYFRIK